mgnify:CR=1 FL=1
MLFFEEKKQELLIATLVGITSVGIAYSTYLGSLASWSSVANYSKSNLELNDANATYLASVADNSLTDEERAELHKIYETQWDKSATLIEQADNDNNRSDRYTLVSVLYTVILFLGSMATTARTIKYRWSYLSSGYFLFLCVTIGMLLI